MRSEDAVPAAPAGATAPEGMVPARRPLIGLDREDFAALMTDLGEKPFRANQLWHWVYRRKTLMT